MTHSFYRSYGFLAAMLACIVLGCAVGAAVTPPLLRVVGEKAPKTDR